MPRQKKQPTLPAPTKAFDVEPAPRDQGEGWVYGLPAGISTSQWPRSRTNGLPLAHIWTLRVPEPYRTKGSGYVALSLFQADDSSAEELTKVKKVISRRVAVKDPDARPFWEALLAYAENRHPQEIYLKDEIEGGWALIWLTEAEFRGPAPALPDPSAGKFPGYDDADCLSAWQHKPAAYVRQVERKDDPNVGKKLRDWPDQKDPDAYTGIYSEKGQLAGLERFAGKTHFGGTANPVQATPEFSPFYLEFEEGMGGANLGGGNAQIDLLNDRIDWACD